MPGLPAWVNVLAALFAISVLGLFTALGWALVTDYRGMRRRSVLDSFGFVDPLRQHPSWKPVPRPAHDRMIQRQDRVARLVGWGFLLAGTFCIAALSLSAAAAVVRRGWAASAALAAGGVLALLLCVRLWRRRRPASGTPRWKRPWIG